MAREGDDAAASAASQEEERDMEVGERQRPPHIGMLSSMKNIFGLSARSAKSDLTGGASIGAFNSSLRSIKSMSPSLGPRKQRAAASRKVVPGDDVDQIDFDVESAHGSLQGSRFSLQRREISAEMSGVSTSYLTSSAAVAHASHGFSSTTATPASQSKGILGFFMPGIRMLSPKYLSFRSCAVEDEFRALSWRRNWIFYVIGSWVLMIIVTLTIVPKFRCMVEGKDFCDKEGPFTKVIPVDFDVIPLALIGHFMDLAITLISVIFLTGPRVDCNLGHWVIERLPPSMSPTWLKDDEGNVKLSGVGEFWLYKVAVSSILVANQTFISARNPFYIDAGMTSILWLECVLPLMYGMRFRHAIILFCSSFVVSFIGSMAVFVRDGVTSDLPRAVQGSIMFILMWVTIYMLAMVIHDGEKTSRDEHLVGNIQTTVDDVCKRILGRMLPRKIVDKLVKQTLETGSVEAFAQVYPTTSVLFIQVDVSRNCLDGEDLMAELNRIFSILDNLLNHHDHVFKVETVGAEYMAAAGVPDPCRSPVCALTSFAVHARSHLANVEWSTGVKVGVRMGIHSGSLVAGVAGKKSPRFRLFGDCVNTAARMKAIAKDGEIIVSQDHVETLRGCLKCFDQGGVLQGGDAQSGCDDTHMSFMDTVRVTPFKKIEIKGKGEMNVWNLVQDATSNAITVGWGSTGSMIQGDDWVKRGCNQAPTTVSAPMDTSLKRATILPRDADRSEPREKTGSLLGDWVGFRRELAATEKGYKDIVHLLERIATNLPYGFQLKLSNMPFFAFKDPYLERGYCEVIALRKNQCNACRSNACLYALVAVLFVYAYATCDIDKESHRRQWVATSAVCGLSLLLAPAALVGTNWCLKSMQKQVERYGLAEFEDELYINSRNARRLSMINDFWQVCFCVSIMCIILAPPLIFGELLDDMESKHGWYYLKLSSSRLFVHLYYTFIVWFQRYFKHSIWQRWLFTAVLIVLSTRTIDNDFPFIIFAVLLNYASTKLWITNKIEFASAVKFTCNKMLGEEIIQDLLPHHVIRAAFTKKQPKERGAAVSCGHMFADIVGYTSLASKLKPSEAFLLLSDLYERIDNLCARWGITKVDTIGDCYWCAVGEENGATQNDMVRLLGMALELQEEAKKVYLPPHLGLEGTEGLSFRIGIHYGPCIGGIVGIKMPRYHLFGSHVEVANMLEQTGSEGCIHMSMAAGRFTGITDGGIVSWDSLYPQSKARGGDVLRTPHADASAHSKALMGDGEAMWHDMYSKGLRLTNSAYKIPDDKVGEIEQLLGSAGSGAISRSQLPAEDGSFNAPESEFQVFPTCLITAIHLGSS